MKMIANTVSSYALQGLLSHLEEEYYTPVEKLCGTITDCITGIHHGDVHQIASLYTDLSKNLVMQVTRYLQLRRLSLLPYLEELQDKEDSGHDCLNCGGSCSISHSRQVNDIQDAHVRIKEILEKLHAITAPLPHEMTHVDRDQVLHVAVKAMDELLSDLLFLEETALIPKIAEAQKAINAHR